MIILQLSRVLPFKMDGHHDRCLLRLLYAMILNIFRRISSRVLSMSEDHEIVSPKVIAPKPGNGLTVPAESKEFKWFLIFPYDPFR